MMTDYLQGGVYVREYEKAEFCKLGFFYTF